jgi:hypothetical protein
LGDGCRALALDRFLELFFRQVSDPQRGLERALFVGANSQEIGAISQVPAPSLRHFGDES